jgi:hypothetical protein
LNRVRTRGSDADLACGNSPPDYPRLNRRKLDRMNQIGLIQQRLADAGSLPAVLAVSWEIFELIVASACVSAGESPEMYPAFTFARSSAVSGRNAVAFAPSMPTFPGTAVHHPPEPPADVCEVADTLVSLASALSVRLRESAGLAADAADRSACESAASEAERIAWLLAGGN